MKENKNKMLNEIKIIKNELTEKMRKEISLLKNIKIINYINKAIMQFNLKYSKQQIIKIFDHALNMMFKFFKKVQINLFIFVGCKFLIFLVYLFLYITFLYLNIKNIKI